jgi:putative transposase
VRYDPEKHHRRSIRLKGYDYSNTGAYFLTICTKNRECLFGDIEQGQMILNAAGNVVKIWWPEMKNKLRNVELDEFIIMPNHSHGIVFIETDFVGAIHELPLHVESRHEYQKQRRKMLLPKFIGWFKMNSAKQINQSRNTPGTPVWQRNYYEHIIRNEKELNKIRQYIVDNPVKWDMDENNPVNLKQNGGSIYKTVNEL